MSEEGSSAKYKGLRESFDNLRLRHARRRKSPLRFVEAYDQFTRELEMFEMSEESPDPAAIPWMKRFLEKAESDYELCYPKAEEQAARNEALNRFYRLTIRTVGGGRADGNKR